MQKEFLVSFRAEDWTFDFMHLREQFNAEMSVWLKEGKVKYQETIYDGIENAPKALIGMLNGLNTGKMMVRLPE